MYFGFSFGQYSISTYTGMLQVRIELTTYACLTVLSAVHIHSTQYTSLRGMWLHLYYYYFLFLTSLSSVAQQSLPTSIGHLYGLTGVWFWGLWLLLKFRKLFGSVPATLVRSLWLIFLQNLLTWMMIGSLSVSLFHVIVHVLTSKIGIYFFSI